MSSHKDKIRKNKTCLNCGFFVEKEYCPNCGQQNMESRHSFHHLFTHFIFDLIHYESSFWRTTKLLFLSPAKLSQEYMAGKRKSYVNPFTLYIFVSFLAFLIPTLLPSKHTAHKDREFIEITDSIKGLPEIIISEYGSVYSPAELDSIHNSRPPESKISALEYYGYKYVFYGFKNVQDGEKHEKAIEFFLHNLPKVLFIYMPLFAFSLWLFHNKKKHYYFDSGIFTLHFFSVVLLTITIFNVLSNAFMWMGIEKYVSSILAPAMIIYITFYFFRGNRIFYQERRFISNLKAIMLLIINTTFIFITLLLYAAFIFYKIFLTTS